MSIRHMINWFEIPANDLERAKKFYNSLFGYEFYSMQLDNFKMEMFPMDEGAVSGALVYSPGNYETGAQGPLLYLNAMPDIQAIVDKVEQAGGKVLLPKTEISKEYGYMALILDTEGNKIGLHAMQ